MLVVKIYFIISFMIISFGQQLYPICGRKHKNLFVSLGINYGQFKMLNRLQFFIRYYQQFDGCNISYKMYLTSGVTVSGALMTWFKRL